MFYRPASNNMKDQVYLWARELGCPENQLPAVWRSFVGKSLALTEKSAFIQVAQIVTGLGIQVDVHRFREAIDSI